MNPDPLVIAGREFASRLIVGTGKYSSFQVMQRAHEASGVDMVTVAVRRVNISDRTKESLLDYIDTTRIALLPRKSVNPAAAARTAMTSPAPISQTAPRAKKSSAVRQ